MWFQHDGAQLHYNREMGQWLPENNPGYWIIADAKLQFPGLNDWRFLPLGGYANSRLAAVSYRHFLKFLF
jgi:hypothetical protein